jgi:hypothetical protein
MMRAFKAIPAAPLALVLVGATHAPAHADDAKPTPIAVPYRLTPTQHVLVRVKLNGKGPFNFILDTGAPALFVAKKPAEKAGAVADARGWSRFDRLEVEGGVVFEPAMGLVQDLFQLEGMNGMGLAGVELHGVIGYNLLARFRIEFDFTRDKLHWTKLNFEPQALARMGGRSAPGGLDAIGGILKFLGGFLGLKANFAVEPRGFLGAEFSSDDDKLIVRRLLPGGPADNSGLRVGDHLSKIAGDDVSSIDDVAKRLGQLPAQSRLKLTVLRDGKEIPLAIELGKGL